MTQSQASFPAAPIRAAVDTPSLGDEQRGYAMINGAHVIIYSKDAEADRKFFKDVLGFHSVDAGHGWLIFALPPAEVACHPGENDQHQLYLMCEDLKAEISALAEKGIECAEVKEPPWAILTTLAF